MHRLASSCIVLLMTEPDDGRVGAVIRTLRESQRLSSDELGRRVGLTGGFIRHIETGRRRANIAQCQDIAQALGVDLAAIVGAKFAEVVAKGYDAIGDEPAKAAS